jgi:hypothetical protein
VYGRLRKVAAVARRIFEAATNSIAFVIFRVLRMDLIRALMSLRDWATSLRKCRNEILNVGLKVGLDFFHVSAGGNGL